MLTQISVSAIIVDLLYQNLLLCNEQCTLLCGRSISTHTNCVLHIIFIQTLFVRLIPVLKVIIMHNQLLLETTLTVLQ